MNKQFIQNRHNQKLAVVAEEQEDAKGLAFVMHGQGGFKEQPHIRTFAEAFLEKGFTVVSFDAANTIGESGGNMEDASITSYYEDLEDVIEWAQSQKWYQEPFALAGHSLGGICTALYAEHHPEKILGVAPISTVVSGKLSWETHSKKELDDWKHAGYRITQSRSKPGVAKKLKWHTMEDRLQYDLLEKADKLAMPVLLIVGDKDTTTPLSHYKLLFDKLPGKKELHAIPGAKHTFREHKHLEEIKKLFLNWIDAL